MEKKHRVEVLGALLEMHQQQHERDDEYIKGLRQRLKQAQTQLENMRPWNSSHVGHIGEVLKKLVNYAPTFRRVKQTWQTVHS
jgi:hypothetical protein